MVQKRLVFDPTLVRYTEPYMDDNDAKNTGGKFRMIPIFDKAVAMAVATRGSRSWSAAAPTARRSPHGTQALEFEALVKRAGMTPARAIQAGTIVNAEVDGLAGRRSARLPRASSPISSPCPAIRWPTSPSSSA